MNSVLIVDDNRTLARLTARNLERDIPGLQVHTVSSCRDARQALETLSPSVLVADLRLEDGSGFDLAGELAECRPGLSVILISGEEHPPLCGDRIFAMVMKPYEAAALADLVRRAIEKGKLVPKTEGERKPAVACAGYRSHYVRNLLGDLVLSLRVLSRELKDQAHNPAAVVKLAEQRFDYLCEMVMEVSALLPVCPQNTASEESPIQVPIVQPD
jgi:FixJ family two-component response regulator